MEWIIPVVAIAVVVALVVNALVEQKQRAAAEEKLRHAAELKEEARRKEEEAAAEAKRLEAEAAAEAKRLEDERIARLAARRRSISFKVAGVTFKNGDGVSRQKLLAKYHKRFHSEKYDYDIKVTLQPYTYQDGQSIRILFDDDMVGNVPEDDIPEVLEALSCHPQFDIDNIGTFYNDENIKIYYASVTGQYLAPEE